MSLKVIPLLQAFSSATFRIYAASAELLRKSYMAYRMAQIPMTLSAAEGHFCSYDWQCASRGPSAAELLVLIMTDQGRGHVRILGVWTRHFPSGPPTHKIRTKPMISYCLYFVFAREKNWEGTPNLRSELKLAPMQQTYAPISLIFLGVSRRFGVETLTQLNRKLESLEATQSV